jgi:hypothetical protein
MLPVDLKIARLQDTLRRMEEDVPLLAMRVRELSAERQQSATQFAASLMGRARLELEKLLEQRGEQLGNDDEACEPAD